MPDPWQKQYRRDTEEVIRESWWTFWKVFWLIIVAVIVIGAIGWAINLASQPARIVTKTMDADNVIFNYEHFYNLWNDIKAISKKIEDQDAQIAQFKVDTGPRENWGFADKDAYDKMQQTLVGLKQYRQTIIAQYNSDSSKLNRSLFKGKDLPYRVNEDGLEEAQ
jgi:cell division protein FtsL